MPNSTDHSNDDATINDGTQDGVNDGTGVTLTPVLPTASDDDGDDPSFATMTDRERALVVKARAEEKRKLYKRLNDSDLKLRQLQDQLAALQRQPIPANPDTRQTRDEKIDQLLTQLQTLSAQQQETNAQIREMQQAERDRTNRTNLERYAQTLIAEVRAKGDDVILPMVGGDTEEEVEESVKIARAEWVLTVQRDREKRGNGRPPSVTVTSNGRRPAGTPPVQGVSTVEADQHENIDELTSDAAVRSGDYEKHRNQLFSRLRRGYKYGGQPSA